MKTRAIAEAKVKTDKVDAAILAQLLAADYLPPVWMPDDASQAVRRQVARRANLVRQRTRLKNQVPAILQRNLIPRCPFSDMFGIKGRCWLANQPLATDEQFAMEALLRQLDFHGQELRIIDQALGRIALERAEVQRLMTIPGVDATVALSILAAVGDFHRFAHPQRLVSYLGLNPRVRQSGDQPASNPATSRPAIRRPAGQSSSAGARARAMLVEAAWVAVRTPGPLRAFYERIRSRRGMQIAVVATARKLAVLCWHLIIKDEDYGSDRGDEVPEHLRTEEGRRAAFQAAKERPAQKAGRGEQPEVTRIERCHVRRPHPGRTPCRSPPSGRTRTWTEPAAGRPGGEEGLSGRRRAAGGGMPS